jgi:hypothetical protein
MKKLFLIIACISFFSCKNEEELRSDLKNLRNEKREVQKQISEMEENLNHLHNTYNDLGVLMGDVGIFVLEIKQSTLTFDIGEHLKNSMNSIEISIPVDADFYTQYNEGDLITSQGKMGSFLIDGDFSKLNIKVKRKYSIVRGID